MTKPGAVGTAPAARGGDARPRRRVDRELLSIELDRLEIIPVSDPTAAFSPAVDIERDARRIGAVDLEMRAQLVQADVLGRMGKTTAGGQVLRQVNTWAVAHDDAHLLARSHRLLAMFFDRIGDFAAGLEHSLRAVELLSAAALPRLRADHLHGLAMAQLRLRTFDDARDRYAAVLALAEQINDDALQVKVLNDIAWLEDEAGNADRAMQLALRMKAFAAQHEITLDAACVDTLAHAHVRLGQYAEAVDAVRAVTDDPDVESRPTEGLAELLRTAAAALRGLGDLDGAHRALQRCLQICDERQLADVRVQVLEELAELYATEGRYREAYAELRLFHDESIALHSAEREARSHTLQAVFEVAEARREGERFRELAMLDALTGLRNRRYVDTELPSLVREAVQGNCGLAIALVDLDHFKRVNDTLSHSVGDEVLRRVAAILDDAVGDEGFAARVGGEEFLLVLRDVSADEAAECWEAARIDVRSYPWQALTAGLPVTVSVGGTTVGPQRGTQAALLGQADRNLYTAKRAGRDRVVTDGG
ncbi:MAG: GGDEF domain-containing protein [Candidatus Dormibacteraeota bacterium]|nr:GGDEF domain-containing protein [Candidatus Dormibacteraeota bacterium]